MNKLFLIAATAALFFATGCERTNSIPAGQSRIVVKLNGVKAPTPTRNVEAPADASGTDDEAQSEATLETAWVFVISEAEGVFCEQIDNIADAVANGFTIGEGKGTSGDYNDKLFPSDSRVYILGNVPSDVDPESLTSWTDIEEAVSVISYTDGEQLNVDFTKPAMANADGKPAELKNVEPKEHTADVEIALSPLYSRVELHKITGKSHIVDFDVAGVYINNYYRAFDMTGAGYADEDDEDLKFFVHPAGSTTFDGWGDTDGWESSTGTKSGNGVQPRATVNGPDDGKVWAYNVGSGSVVTFIIELTNVRYYAEDEDTHDFDESPSTYSEKMYLNVVGYTGLVGKFERGNIYRIEDLQFDVTDLTEDPVTGVSIEASVNVLNWKVKALSPILGN